MNQLSLTFLILFFFGPYSIAQDTTEHKQNVIWMMHGKRKPKGFRTEDAGYTGYVIEYRSDSLIVQEGMYVNGFKDSTWLRYYEDGATIKLIGTYKRSRPNGSFQKFYPNGHIKEIGTYIRNRYIDSLIRYFPSGCVQYEVFYNENGNEEGQVNYYYDCDSSSKNNRGQIEFEYTAKDGVPQGTARKYYHDSELKEKIVYDLNGLKLSDEIFLIGIDKE